MATPQILIEQVGNVPGVAGQSRRDLVRYSQVTLSVPSHPDASSFSWTMIGPPGSAAVLSSVSAPSPTFTPDMDAAGWLIFVEVDGQKSWTVGGDGEKISEQGGCFVPDVHGHILPVASETLQDSPTSGWAAKLDDFLRFVNTTFSGGGGGWVKIADVSGQPGVVVSNKAYQDAGNTVIQSATISGLSVTLDIRASSPLISINGGATQELSLSADGGHYSGQLDVTLIIDGNVTAQVVGPDGDTGLLDTVTLTLDAPPELQTLSFSGGYPGGQTELKAGDTFQIVGTTDVPADAVEVQDFGASDSTQLLTFVEGTSFVVTMTIGDRGTTPQALAARVRARNASGAFGGTRDTNTGGGSVDGVNLVTLNDLYPTLTFGAVTYPPTQGALKNSETATVAITSANLDSIVYDSPNGDLAVTDPTVDETPKTVTRIAGSYNDSVNNFRGVATRDANGAVTTTQAVVIIANVAPTITVAEPAARLRSGGNDGTTAQNHTITLTSNQNLAAAPTLNADVGGGTFLAAWAGGPKVWTRSLQVHDDDVKGTYSYQGLVATGLSGLVQNSISGDSSYVLGGFVARSITWSAFSQQENIGVAVVDYSKLQAGVFTATGNPAQRNPVQGNTDNIVDTYTVLSIGSNPTSVYWNDDAAASTNSTGTAQLTNIEETV